MFCGCPVDSSVAIALRSVDLWSDGPEEKVVVLENLNDALEVNDFVCFQIPIKLTRYPGVSTARTPS